MSEETLDEGELIPRRSSWAAALAQLPGFPGERPPLPTAPARDISLWDADEREEQTA